ncbi:MAG: hypothetical protein K6U89_20390 [Chloroflexi bacterium]|nr:hypothetical protein [Chloroflexota bacterium]
MTNRYQSRNKYPSVRGLRYILWRFRTFARANYTQRNTIEALMAVLNTLAWKYRLTWRWWRDLFDYITGELKTPKFGWWPVKRLYGWWKGVIVRFVSWPSRSKLRVEGGGQGAPKVAQRAQGVGGQGAPRKEVQEAHWVHERHYADMPKLSDFPGRPDLFWEAWRAWEAKMKEGEP